MRRTQPSTPHVAPSEAARALAIAILGGGLLLLATGLSSGAWSGGQAPLPYVWLDVALVHLLCALPLGVVVSGLVLRRWPGFASTVVAGSCLAGSITMVLLAVHPSWIAAVKSSWLLGASARSIPALGLTIAGALVWTALRGRRHRPEPLPGSLNAAALVLLPGIVLLLAPATYVAAHNRHDAGRLGEFLDQSRFGEARRLIAGLLILDPGGLFRGRPLAAVAVDIEQLAGELERRVAAPLPVGASSEDRLDRAQNLAMLGRTAAALVELSSLDDPAALAEVATLRGSIYESQAAWDQALSSYRNAAARWQSQPPSEARTAGLVRAATGIAYAQRKSGQYAAAEASYRQLLAQSPTADSHFLLAQFYEDSQQADKARQHARHAMTLAPGKYQQPGEKFIRKLTLYHFGCLSVYRSEQAGARGGE